MTEKVSTINKKIWNMATVLMNDGVSNSDYLEQLTYLLFLKMADEYSKPPFERKIGIPENCLWDTLVGKKGAALSNHYKFILEELAKQDGILKEIYGGSQNKISTPAMLAKIIKMIDAETWTAINPNKVWEN